MSLSSDNIQGTRAPDPGLGELVARAQRGDEDARERLLRDFQPFVMRAAATAGGRYVDARHDDEASIALIAFNEAITSYQAGAGASFLTFAEIVIRRRLIDYYRRVQKRMTEIPMSGLEGDGDQEGPTILQAVEARDATRQHQVQVESEERREEIARLSRALADFGIRFSDLVEASPKHKDARERAIEVARLVASQPTWTQTLVQRKVLPLKELAAKVGMSRKTLERHRKYIVAMSLVLIGEYGHLQAYLERRGTKIGGTADQHE